MSHGHGFVPPKPPPPGVQPAPAYRRRRPRKHNATQILSAAAVILIVATGITFVVLVILRDSNSAPLGFNPLPVPIVTPTTTAVPTTATITTSPTRPALVIDRQLTQDLQHTFDALVSATTGGDGPALAALFDGSTLFDNLRELGLLSHLTPKTRPAAANAFVADVVGLIPKSKFFPFTQLTVLNVQPLPGADRVRVSTRAKTPTHNLKYLWWLKKSDDGAWRIYDFETPAATHRWFLMAANNESVKNPPGQPRVGRWTIYTDTLVMMRDDVTRGVADGVPKRNALLIEQKILFPPQIEGIRALLRGEAELLANRPVEALNFFSQAERLPIDQPRIPLLRAQAYLALDNPRKALDAATQYLDLVGDDAQAYALIGKAHQALDQRQEAVTAYQSGLADDPADADCRAGLARLR